MLAMIHTYVIPAAYSILPESMKSERATAMLLAIALQESLCIHRKQVGGPARGFWQFESGGGVAGVRTHPMSRNEAQSTMLLLRYPTNLVNADVHKLLEHNDVLAAVFARLLLWTLPAPLPKREDPPQVSWNQYLAAWRPGRPHPDTWPENHARAWALLPVVPNVV